MYKASISCILGLILCVNVDLTSQAEFIEVVHQEDLNRVLQLAGELDRLLFVNVYASWSGPGKMMESEVYADPSVGDYMNTRFVNVRINGESDFGRVFSGRYGLEEFPAAFLLNPEGVILRRMEGFRPAGELLPVLRDVHQNYRLVRSLQPDVIAGTIRRDSLALYIRALGQMGDTEGAEELALIYIRNRTQEILSDTEIRVISPYTDLEDPWWPQLAMDERRLKRVLGERYHPVLEKIYENTLILSVETGNVKLVSRIARELSPMLEEGDASRDLRTLPFLQYFYYTGQHTELVEYVEERYQTDRKGDSGWLFGAASQVIDMDQKDPSPELMATSEEWLKECIRLEARYDYYFYLGMSRILQEKITEARESFETARKLAETEEQKQMIEQVLRYVNAP